jgi:GntR family transcriptional regulator
MEPPYDPASGTPGYQYLRFADYTAAQIEDGTLSHGSRLSGEHTMAHEHGIAIGTVRRAIGELRARRLVIVLPAKGVYVVRPELSVSSTFKEGQHSL